MPRSDEDRLVAGAELDRAKGSLIIYSIRMMTRRKSRSVKTAALRAIVLTTQPAKEALS